MAIKLDSATNESVIAYHLIDGPKVFAYKVDAHHAVSNFPNEWSDVPWTAAKASEARAELEQRHTKEVEEAKAKGLPVPKDLPPPPPPLDPEDEAALMEYNTAVAEATERLKVAREKAAKKKAEDDQIAADEALVASPPPQPDPTKRRPSPAQIRKAAATLSPEEQSAKVAADKAAADAGTV